MRLVIQRVSKASVTPDGLFASSIGRGLVILAGFTHDDTEDDVRLLAKKCLDLRIFEDQSGKINLSVRDIKGGLLAVSQFTLYADVRRGRRPSFTQAAEPKKAEELYSRFVEALKQSGLEVQTGSFGAKMSVELHNDGPVTIIMHSAELRKSHL
jgi:D-tyrosyl-tRNA(Tyr) deacylase